MKKDVVIQMMDNMEARPIALLVQTANRFSSQIYLEMGSKRVNAKSIMGMMNMALLNGETVTVEAEGEDAAAAIEAMEKFLKEK